MALFKVVTPSEVQTKMALPSIEASLPVIEAAIQSAQLRMEAELSTRFDFDSREDTFKCDPTLLNVVPNGYFRLCLSRGFVRTGALVTLDGTDVTAECKVVQERGHVYIPEELATDRTVIVSYDSGFQDGEEVPDWLKEAVLSYVPAAFYMGNPDVRDDSASSEVIDRAAAHAIAVCSNHTRRLNFSLPPVFTED